MTASASIARAPSPAPSLRERLRADTREAHEALDASFAHMFSDLSRERYRSFIAMNLAAHEAIEPLLAASPLGRRDVSAADRLEAARRDAEALGIAPSPEALFPVREVDLFQAFGIAYVLEGSRLGAKFMLRAMKRGEASGGTGLPTHYLQASSDAQPFARLIERMDAEPASEADVLRAVEAADATFRFFRALSNDDQERTAGV